MKKILVGFIFAILLSIPSIVLAESNLVIECDDNNVAGQVLECTLKSSMDTGIAYNKIESKIDLLDTITFEWESGFRGNLVNQILTINSDSEIGNTTIGRMKVKFPIDVTGNQKIGLSDIKFYNDSTVVANSNKASDNVTVKSDVNTLDSLTLSDCDGCKLSPSFSSNLTIYVVKTTSDKINISAKASGNATVSGDGEKTLTKDKETFEITVTSEAGNTKKYKITVQKEKLESSDNTLKSLTLNEGELEPVFSNDVTNYELTLDKEEVTISAVANDSNAKVTGIGTKSLEYGKNEFTIVVTAENGNSKSYLININRPDTRNTNAYLKELTINGEKINFEKDIVEYIYTVGNSITSLDIEAVAELETSKVTITGDKDLVVGKNKIIITVEAEDESKKEYKIIVTRDEIDRSELYLETLQIEGYDIDFSKEKFDYNLTIKDEKTLIIDAIPESEDYSIEILGNSDLKNGSIIKIIITDEDNNTNIYKIKINVESNEEIIDDDNSTTDDINYIPIIMTSLLVILAVLDIIQIIKKVRKK